jgi:hypothetical protein
MFMIEGVHSWALIRTSNKTRVNGGNYKIRSICTADKKNTTICKLMN